MLGAGRLADKQGNILLVIISRLDSQFSENESQKLSQNTRRFK